MSIRNTVQRSSPGGKIGPQSEVLSYTLLHEQYHRKQWVKRQRIVHSYGDEEEELEDPDELRTELEKYMHKGTVLHNVPAVSNKPDGVDVILGGKKCKCGSTTHQRISHRDCPLNKKQQSSL